MNSLSDFVVSDGVLVDYNGPGGNVVIPEGVQEIKSGYFDGEFWTDKGAFDYCNTITSIVMPNSLRRIDEWTFAGHKELKKIIVSDALLDIYPNAFADCIELTEVMGLSPKIDIADNAFCNCPKLKVFPMECVVSNGFSIFGKSIPTAIMGDFICQFENLLPNLTDAMIKVRLAAPEDWDTLSFSSQMDLLLNHQSKPLGPVFQKCISNPVHYVDEIIRCLETKQPVKVYNAVASFIELFMNQLDLGSLQTLYVKLSSVKAASRALKKLNENKAFQVKLGAESAGTEEVAADNAVDAALISKLKRARRHYPAVISKQNGKNVLVINKIIYDEAGNDWTHFTAPTYQPDKVYFNRKAVLDTCNKMKKIGSEVLSSYITCETDFKNGEISAPEAAQRACSIFQSLCDACKREEVLNYAASLAIRKKDGSLFKKRTQVLACLSVLVSLIDSRLLKYAYLYNLIAKNIADDTIEISIERLCIANSPEEDHIILTTDSTSEAADKFLKFVKENTFSSENS